MIVIVSSLHSDLHRNLYGNLMQYLAILRSYPEHEVTFHDLNEFIQETIAMSNSILITPELLRTEWKSAVQRLVIHEETTSTTVSSTISAVHHARIVQVQHVVEMYLCSGLHKSLWKHCITQMAEKDVWLYKVWYKLRHVTPLDLDISTAFQVNLQNDYFN